MSYLNGKVSNIYLYTYPMIIKNKMMNARISQICHHNIDILNNQMYYIYKYIYIYINIYIYIYQYRSLLKLGLEIAKESKIEAKHEISYLHEKIENIYLYIYPIILRSKTMNAMSTINSKLCYQNNYILNSQM